MDNNSVQEEQKMSEQQYGDCDGPNSMYIKLVANDGHEFIVKRKHAIMSGTIKALLSEPVKFKENETAKIHFPGICSDILNKVCVYLAYKAKYTNSFSAIPEFDIKSEEAMELLMAANVLDC